MGPSLPVVSAGPPKAVGVGLFPDIEDGLAGGSGGCKGCKMRPVPGAGGGRKDIAVMVTKVKHNRVVERKINILFSYRLQGQYPDEGGGVWTPGSHRSEMMRGEEG